MKRLLYISLVFFLYPVRNFGDILNNGRFLNYKQNFIDPFSNGVNYEKIFPEYDDAVSFIKQNHAGFYNIHKTDANKKDIMISIIFPELIRYSLFKDFFETKSLEIGYVQYGAKLVDFSIGRFQMKPSFVETLENLVLYRHARTLHNKYYEITAFKDTTITGIRKERVERLSSLKWQLIYLECFYDIISEKFKDIKWQDDVEMLKFYATAYNHNFCASKKEIDKWLNAKTFPYGASYKGEQYSYSDIAVYFYNNLLKNQKS